MQGGSNEKLKQIFLLTATSWPRTEEKSPKTRRIAVERDLRNIVVVRELDGNPVVLLQQKNGLPLSFSCDKQRVVLAQLSSLKRSFVAVACFAVFGRRFPDDLLTKIFKSRNSV